MRVSIVTVVYNNEAYVGDCIKSVVSQSHGDIEYIVVDGASTDGTMAVIDRYRDRISRVVSEKDDGHIFAMNKGLALATGDVITFLQSDDFYAHGRVIEKVAAAFGSTSAESVYGDLVYVRKDDPARVLRYWRSGECGIGKMRRGWMPPHPAFFVKRGLYEKYGGLDESFGISVDYELVLRFLYTHRATAFYLPDVLVKMRWGGVSNRNLANVVKKTLEDCRACRMHGLGLSTVAMKNLTKIPQFFIMREKEIMG